MTEDILSPEQDLDAMPEAEEPFEAYTIPPKLPLEEEIIARAAGNHEPMPMLDVILGRLATGFSPMLKSKNGFIVETGKPELHYITWGKLMAEIDPNGLAALANSTLGSGIFLAYDSAFIHSTTVQLMGGTPSNTDVLRRAPTTLEKAFCSRLFSQTLDELSEHFSRIIEVKFELDTVESPAQLNALMANESLMAVCDFDVEIGPVVGHVTIILPMHTLEPARERLSKMFLGDKLGADLTWRDHFAGQINDANMTLEVELHRVTLPLTQILNWRPGVTLDLGIDGESEATVICAGHRILKGITGRKRNDKMALRVTQDFIAHEEGHVSEHLLLD